MAVDRVAAGGGERRTALIRSMVEAVRAEGPAASIDDLARVAGVPKSVLYNHFADKDGLLAAVADTVADDWGGRPPVDGRAAVEGFVAIAEIEPQLYDLVRSGGDRRAVSLRVERIGAGIVAAVTSGHADPDPVTAAAVGGALFAVVDQWLQRGATDRDTLVDELLTFVQGGLRHPPGA